MIGTVAARVHTPLVVVNEAARALPTVAVLHPIRVAGTTDAISIAALTAATVAGVFVQGAASAVGASC